MIFKGTRMDLLKRLPKGQRCAEVGVLRGGFSAAILAYAKPSKLLLIDLWRQQDPAIYHDKANVSDVKQEQTMRYVMRRFARQRHSGVVEVIRGYSDTELLKLPCTSLDWVYLDANHSEECVTADLQACMHTLTADGLIMGHDYCEQDDEGHKFGVIPAVTKFLKRTPGLNLIAVTDEEYPTYMLAADHRIDELTALLG